MTGADLRGISAPGIFTERTKMVVRAPARLPARATRTEHAAMPVRLVHAHPLEIARDAASLSLPGGAG
jgi:hypothetical protein